MPGSRIIVPAEEAFTATAAEGVHKTKIPYVKGKDISYYENIERGVDFFFDLKKKSPRYLVAVGSDGYGLLHTSSERLQSRKLFTWGHVGYSHRWQEYLTDKAGPYVEVQAGLGKN